VTKVKYSNGRELIHIFRRIPHSLLCMFKLSMPIDLYRADGQCLAIACSCGKVFWRFDP